MKKTPAIVPVLPIANTIALILTFFVNYYSNTGALNGHTVADISAQYPTLLTPAGYAFAIWGLIYLALIGFIIFQWRNTPAAQTTVRQVGWWFVLSCLANCAWLFSWLYDYIGLSVIIMIGLLVCLQQIIWRTDMELTDPPLGTIAAVWWPFCLYSGWITTALLADFFAWITKINGPIFAENEAGWAIDLLLLAGAIYLWMTWKRNMREYAMTGVWALVAIAIADQPHTLPSPIIPDTHRAAHISAHPHALSVAITAYVLAALLFISSSVHGYRNRAYSPWRKH